MNKVKTLFRSLLMTGVVVGLIGGASMAKEKPAHEKDKESLAKVKGVNAYQPDRYQILNINNLWSWHREDGQSNHSPTGDNGTFFPRGTSFIIYQDGMVFGSKAYVDEAKTIPAPFGQTIRVGGATYGTGQREGWVEGFGATARAVDKDDPRARIYRIRRDWKEMSEEELRRDAAESNEININDVTANQMQQILDEYQWSWDNWPVDLGAPYIERNGQPGYQPPPADFAVADLINNNYDEPGLAGADPNSPADQVIFTIFNDLHRPTSVGRFGSEPTGLEIQMTMWGYKRTDALGNIFFRKWRIINKGGVDIDGSGTLGAFYLDSMYVCQWSDPDLGSFSDDLVGCDTVLSLGFVYNGNAVDTDFRKFNLPPPSGGYDFLQGPAVPSPGDEGIFDLKRVQGIKNLGMTGFSYFSAGSPYSDPRGGYETNTIAWYKMLRGFAPLLGPDVRYNFPPGMTPGPFPLAGDPVAGTGHIDGQGTDYSFVPGDRRLLVITGPFQMAPGDTQEVVVAFVAGLGADRLSSISVMKFNDRFAQNTYDALFQVPSAPPAPRVNVTELNGKVILDWGSDLQRIADIEQKINQPGNFAFEGYNLYQLPSPTASLSEGKRIATFDVINENTVVLDERFDQNSGQILQVPVQFGSNSGVQRNFVINRDYILDRDGLNNGTDYYFAVTAYSVAQDEGFLPRTLESSVQVLRVVPKVPFGKRYLTDYGDVLPVNHISGRSDGIVTPTVIDPAKIEDIESEKTRDYVYQVRFKTDESGQTLWDLVNTTTGATILADQSNQSGIADQYSMVEGGVFLVVSGPEPGLKRLDQFDTDDQSQWGWEWVSGSRFLTWANADGFGWEAFRGAVGYGSPRWAFGDGTLFIAPDQLKAVEIRFANVDADGNFDPNQPNVSYAYRHGRGFAAAPQKPEFAQWIVNPSGGYAYQDYRPSVPLAVYDIDADPPRRLALAYLENNQPGGMVDGKYWPPFFQDADNTAGSGPREWLWIMDDDYTGETPKPEYQVEIIEGPQPVMYWATWARRNTNPWTDDNVMRLYPTRPNTPSDVFEYTLPAPESTPELIAQSVANIGVFPNPYYAFNPLETNRLSRFVTFNNLPQKATIRIFNLAGQLVRTITKDSESQFQRWDLLNHSGLPVASGMYIAHIELPDLGMERVLKLAIIQEAEVLDTF